MCGEKPEQMEGALSMRLEPVIEWGRRGIKEEGNLEGVDMYLPLGYTLYRAHKNRAMHIVHIQESWRGKSLPG